MKTIAIVGFPEANLLDVGGPAQVFRTAAEQLRESGALDDWAYEIRLLAPEGRWVETSPGVRLEATPIAETDPAEFDTVLIAGGHGAEDASSNGELVAWVRRAAAVARRVGSICTGAFVLAEAGLLEGRAAATHWSACTRLQKRYPGVKVDGDSIFIHDGSLWTSAGVTSGMDMALAMIEEDHGRELALLVARRLVLFLKRPGGQSQFSAPLRSQTVEGPLAPLLQWIVDNPGADLRAESLADRAGMSLRTFYRAFEDATGATPADWVETVRIQLARRLLEQTADHVETVAVKSGFIAYERMRRAFLRRVGVSPAAYRSRFRRDGDARDPATEAAILAASGSR